MPAFLKHFCTVYGLTDSHAWATQRIACNIVTDLTMSEALSHSSILATTN